MLRFVLAVPAALLLAAPTLAATTLNAGIAGTLTTSQLSPVPGQQTFQLNGSFTSYAASSNLPQNVGNDLNQYSFSVSGTAASFNAATRTTVYNNVTGTINGYGTVVQNLSPTTLTVVFTDDTYSMANIFGTLMSAGAMTPTGFPGPVDFTPANGASITGVYTSNGTQGGTVTGRILFPAAAAVPEPAAWALMLVGFGMVGGALRQRRAAVRFA